MDAPSLFLTAAQPFQAARRLSVRDPGAPLHGHGFEARIVAADAACGAAFPGDEVARLKSLLRTAVEPLDYALINDHVDAADDGGIAEWLLARAGLSGSAGLALQSAPQRGAIVRPEGTRLAWHRFRFESAHRLPNVPAGHKCGRMHGHGFEATVFAVIDDDQEASATQARISESWASLHGELHLACLNDLPGLENPTSEVLAAWIWQRLIDALPGLAGVTVMETGSAGCHYDGEGWRIWKAMSIDSAVRLARAPTGDPRRLLHGHTFTTRLHLSGSLDEVMGWVHDYGDVKRRFDPVFKALDHQPLHEKPGLDDNDPATIARHIDAEMATALPGLSRIDVLETPDCGALLVGQRGTRGLLVP
jgi:6-pyruvoyltetrahydropterin/6-carboxytetrahydropterin synthase